MNHIADTQPLIYPYHHIPGTEQLASDETNAIDLTYDVKGNRRSKSKSDINGTDTPTTKRSERGKLFTKDSEESLKKNTEEALDHLHHPKPQAPYSPMSTEEMSHILSTLQVQINSAEFIRKNEQLQDLNDQRKVEHEKKIQTLYKSIEKARNSKHWGGLQALVNSIIQGAGVLGFAGTMTTLSTNPAGWAVMGLMALNTLSTVDEMFNDGAASDTIFKDYDSFRLVVKTGLGLSSAFFSGSLTDLSKTTQYAQTAISAALTGVQTSNKLQEYSHQKEMVFQEDKIVELNKRLTDLLEENKEMASSLGKLFKNMAELNKNQERVREQIISDR